MKKEYSNKKKSKHENLILRLNMAMTMDGHVVEPDGTWSLGSKEDKKRMDILREWSQVVITSRFSIEQDNPNLFIRSKPNKKKQPRPVMILHNTKKPVKNNLRVFEQPHPPGEFWIPVGSEELLEKRSYLEKMDTAPHWQTFLYNNIKDILHSLQQRGYTKILLEGGPSLNSLFLQSELIDEIFFTVVPVIIGGKREDRIVSGFEVPFLSQWNLLSCEKVKNEVFFHYQRKTKKN